MKKNYRTTKLLMFLFFSFALVISAKASIYPFTLTYSGANENPSNASTATGTIMGTYDDFTKRIFYTVTFSGLTTPATGAHFHSPATTVTNAPVIIPFTGFPAATSGTYSGSSLVTTTQETDLFAGKWYANIHSSTYPGGELRVQVILGAASTAIYSFNNMYRGTNEVPSNASTATGTVMGTFNSATNRIIYTITFSGLAGNPTGSHFHGPAGPGTNAPVLVSLPGFPAATSGSYSGTSVLSDLFETQFLSNLWYANLHDATFPGGEIRAQLIPMLPPTITCPANKVVSNSPGLCSASVAFIATSTGVPAPTIVYRIGTTVITSPYVFPEGTTTVTATASNSAGTASCTFTVTVNDTEAPVIHNLSASPNSLWPPNHKMKDVAVNYTTTDNCPGPISCTLSVTSNEAVNGTGDGNTSPDWVVINDHNVQLRAERAGGGDGRIYTITTTCHDQNGNTSSATTTVTVGHDKGKSNKRTESSIKDETTVKGISGLSIRVLNNPSRDHFTLNIQTNSLDKITVRLIDLYGRVIESKFNLSGSQVLQIGSNLNAGTYQVELQQGKQRTQLKLVKIR
jgi:hypothetical protein